MGANNPIRAEYAYACVATLFRQPIEVCLCSHLKLGSPQSCSCALVTSLAYPIVCALIGLPNNIAGRQLHQPVEEKYFLPDN